MARNWDEPFSLYANLAESIETPPDRSWVAFTLNPAARFSDGSPVTVEDVIWSFETLGTLGHFRYRNAWRAVASIEQTGERSLRITFSEANRELPLIMALRPVLKKAQWEGRDFADIADERVIGSGPYIVGEYEPGRTMTFARNPNWWGAALPVNKGLNNFDEIRVEYFRNEDAYLEAVKTGAISLHAEYDPVRWETEYDIPALRDGRLVRDELTHQRPTGLEGFVFNTRRALFADRRVRQALALSFDWEWINDRRFRGAYRRIESAFSGSPLGFGGSAGAAEREILSGFELPEGTLEEGWRPPVSDGSGRDRRNLRAAGRLLDEAGWTVQDGLRQRQGQGFTFEILTSGTDQETLASLWAKQLERLGIRASVRPVDSAQYQQRRDQFDYDMIISRWAMSLSPGTEQKLYFESSQREVEGSRNYMGVADPAVDAAIDALLAAEDPESFQSAVKALDRVLNAGIYVIPFGVLPSDRLIRKAGIRRPDSQHLYGWWGWEAGPARWWSAE